MATLKAGAKTYTYKLVPLYLGVKRIDKTIAKENLLLFQQVCQSLNVKFGLIGGTLLGAVREHDFITHDEDIDLFFLEEDKAYVFDHLQLFIDKGFEIARYDRRGLISVIRKGEYMDLYFFKRYNEKIRNCSGWCIPEKFLVNLTTLTFQGSEFYAPKDYIEYLVYQYGNSWQTPIPYSDFKVKKWKMAMFALKEHLKEILPDSIYLKLAQKSENKLIAKYRPRFQKYL